MPRGTTVVDFGAFPGSSDCQTVITGQPFIAASSQVEAWVRIAASADHLEDEHWVETIRVAAGDITPGVGFIIYAWNTNQINEPLERGGPRDTVSIAPKAGEIAPSVGGMGTRLYGQFNVDWVYVV
jgi:hypothetical protein